MRRRSTARVFAMPLAVAAAAVAGLIAGLVGDGLWDACAWVGLGAPAVAALCLLRGQAR